MTIDLIILERSIKTEEVLESTVDIMVDLLNGKATLSNVEKFIRENFPDKALFLRI
jgi:hypothetical protein